MLTKLENYRPLNPLQWNRYLSSSIDDQIAQVSQDQILSNRILALVIWEHIVWKIDYELLYSIGQKYGKL